MQVELKVNGKTVHAEISEEQAKILGLVEDTPKTGYERGKNGKLYYCVEEDGHLLRYAEGNDSADDNFYGIGNYYSDKTIACRQIATLSKTMAGTKRRAYFSRRLEQ